jgi:HSP20 family protein
VKADSLGLDVERNVLTVHAEHPDVDQSREMVTAERPRGVFSRQLFLGKTSTPKKSKPTTTTAFFRLVIPVAEKAKPRRIEINA